MVWLVSGSNIKQLVQRVADKKSKTKRPKNYGRLSPKERFLAAAKQFQVDETGETFDRTFKTIAKHKPKGGK